MRHGPKWRLAREVVAWSEPGGAERLAQRTKTLRPLTACEGWFAARRVAAGARPAERTGVHPGLDRQPPATVQRTRPETGGPARTLMDGGRRPARGDPWTPRRPGRLRHRDAMTEQRHYDPGAADPRLAPRDRRRWFWAVVLAATALGAASALQTYHAYRMRGIPADVVEIAAYTVPDWFLWAALTPLILALGRRFPLSRPRLWRSAGVHLIVGLLVSFVELLASTGVIALTVGLPEEAPTLWKYYGLVLGFWVVPSFVVYTGILAAGQAYAYYRKYREAEVRAAELSSQLSRARLRSLAWHLRPHFFFNALHAIGVLVRKGERDRALGLVTGLGDLLRHALEHREEMVPLEEEVAFIRRYLEVESVRFGRRLEVSWEVTSEAATARVPSLVLQPLVEDAVRNGLDGSAPHTGLVLAGRRVDGWLEVEVRAEGGRARAGSATGPSSAGAEELRARLRAQYGDRHRLVLVSEEGGARVATLRVPWETKRGATGDGPGLRLAGA